MLQIRGIYRNYAVFFFLILCVQFYTSFLYVLCGVQSLRVPSALCFTVLCSDMELYWERDAPLKRLAFEGTPVALESGSADDSLGFCSVVDVLVIIQGGKQLWKSVPIVWRKATVCCLGDRWFGTPGTPGTSGIFLLSLLSSVLCTSSSNKGKKKLTRTASFFR